MQFHFLQLLTLFSFCASQFPVDKLKQIDQLIENFMKVGNIPGFGLAIVKYNGSQPQYTLSKGFGLADIENMLPTNNKTLFGIGSITKSFTATIIVKTLSEMYPELGESVLDTPIRLLAPSYNFTLGDRYRSESTSFRDLLSYRIGVLPELLGMWVGSYTGSEDMFYRHRYAPTVHSFRSGYLYNNGLIGMAGDIIAHMANSTYYDMLEELLTGIGMSDTTYVKESDDHNNIEGRSVPYFWKDGKYMRYNTSLLKTVVIVNAAGGILSSSLDMGKYMQFHLELGNVEGEQIVSAEAMQWLRKISTLSPFGVLKTEHDPGTNVDLTVGYALCLNVGIYDGWLKVFHGGYLPPYESLMLLYPGQGLGIFTAINGPGSMYYTEYPMNILQNEIFDILQGSPSKASFTNKAASSFGPFPQTLNKLQLSHPERKQPVSKIKLEPQDIVGTFGNGLNGNMDITLKQNAAGVEQAYLEYGTWGMGWLNQTSDMTFEILWETDFWQLSWTSGSAPSLWEITFLDENTLQITENGERLTDLYVRGVTVDDLPEIPWTPDSCWFKDFSNMNVQHVVEE